MILLLIDTTDLGLDISIHIVIYHSDYFLQKKLIIMIQVTVDTICIDHIYYSV